MTTTLLQQVISIPIIAGALLAVGPFISPTFRWTRRAKNDLELAEGLPKGPEQAALESSAIAYSRRLIAYRKSPIAGRSLNWVLFSLFVGSWGSIAIFGLDSSWMGPSDWVAFALGSIVGLFGTIGALSGRLWAWRVVTVGGDSEQPKKLDA